MAGRKDVYVSKGHRRQGNDAPCCVFQTIPAGLDNVDFTYETRIVSGGWIVHLKGGRTTTRPGTVD